MARHLEVLLDLRLGGQAVCNQRTPYLIQVRHLELDHARPDHREVGVGGHLGQPRLAHQPGQSPAVPRVRTTFPQQDQEPGPDVVGQVLFGALRIQAGLGLQGGVEVLDQQPAAGADGRHHAAQRRLPIRQVHQYQPGVHQIEVVPGRVVDRHVVLADLHPASRVGVHPLHVNVGGQHVSARADPVAEQPGHRRAARAHLPAAPPWADTQRVDVPGGHRVEQRGQRAEPPAGVRGGVVQQVAGLGVHLVHAVHAPSPGRSPDSSAPSVQPTIGRGVLPAKVRPRRCAPRSG